MALKRIRLTVQGETILREMIDAHFKAGEAVADVARHSTDASCQGKAHLAVTRAEVAEHILRDYIAGLEADLCKTPSSDFADADDDAAST